MLESPTLMTLSMNFVNCHRNRSVVPAMTRLFGGRKKSPPHGRRELWHRRMSYRKLLYEEKLETLNRSAVWSRTARQISARRTTSVYQIFTEIRRCTILDIVSPTIQCPGVNRPELATKLDVIQHYLLLSFCKEIIRKTHVGAIGVQLR